MIPVDSDRDGARNEILGGGCRGLAHPVCFLHRRLIWWRELGMVYRRAGHIPRSSRRQVSRIE